MIKETYTIKIHCDVKRDNTLEIEECKNRSEAFKVARNRGWKLGKVSACPECAKKPLYRNKDFQCIDCQTVFKAYNSRSVRCWDCQQEHTRKLANGRKIYKRNEAASNG